MLDGTQRATAVFSEGWLDGAQWCADVALGIATTEEERALAERLAELAVEARADYVSDSDEHTAG